MDHIEYDGADFSSIMDQINADNLGLTLKQYKELQIFSSKIREEAEKYKNTPSCEWPKIDINWDLQKTSQRFSLDGVKESKFEINYPKGFSLGHVSLADFDKTLCHYSRRDSGELWSVGCVSKLSYLIVYLSKGYPVSPPLVSPNTELIGQTILQGGHHRYAIAKEIGESIIPIYVEPENKLVMDDIVSIKWDNID